MTAEARRLAANGRSGAIPPTPKDRLIASAGFHALSRRSLVALLGVGLPALATVGRTQASPAGGPVTTSKAHALSLFGDVKYPEDFPHFDYVNPDAPKGGRVRLYDIGSFDSLHPYVVQGEPALGVPFIYDTLLAASFDEPSTDYGLLAEEVEVPSDFAWVVYTLRDIAHFHDGAPVTPDDVISSMQMLKEKGQPFYRAYYANIVEVTKVGDRSIKFTFDQTGNRELPLITGQLVVFPKHYWDGRDFSRGSLEPHLGSGPYRIGKFEARRFVEYERVEDYWAKDLPVMKGVYNFDRIRFEYYLDSDVALTAFFGDDYDLRLENSAKNWATAYTTPAVKSGAIKREVVKDKNPAPLQGFFFNLRRDKFNDRLVRQALGLAYNFDWIQKNVYYGQYAYPDSYFENSELAARGLPSENELELLLPHRDRLPEELFTREFKAPRGDVNGFNRENLREAMRLLNLAGYVVKNGVLVEDDTDKPFTIELMLVDESFGRLVQPYIADLAKLGIKGTMRVVDTSQYQQRIETFDFDMVTYGISQSLSPGNEQREYFGSQAADRPGSRNVAGIKSPVVDAIIEKLIYAEDRASLVTSVHALDRVLVWNFYCVPQLYNADDRYAYWDRFGRPDPYPPHNSGIPILWWYKGEPKKPTDGAS